MAAEPLERIPGTQALTIEGDIAAKLLSGVDKFVMRQLDQTAQQRDQYWQRDLSSVAAHAQSVQPNRERLRYILGLRDARREFSHPQIVTQSLAVESQVIARGGGGEDGAATYEVLELRWPTVGDVHASGLMLRPIGEKATSGPVVIAIPDADQTPEQIAGLSEGVAGESQFARRLAESGVRVVVPLLVNRGTQGDKVPGDRGRSATITSREFLHRSAYQLGRTLVGTEIQAVLALVDWAKSEPAKTPVGVFGWGEGGRIALYAGAVDERIDAVGVSGYFGPREAMWQEPADRNVWDLLTMFGDAEVATLLAGRTLVIEAAEAPHLLLEGGKGKPGELRTPTLVAVKEEVTRTAELMTGLMVNEEVVGWSPDLVVSGSAGAGPFGTQVALSRFLQPLGMQLRPAGPLPRDNRADFDPRERQLTLMYELDRHYQDLLRRSHSVRQDAVWSRFDTESVEAYQRSIEPLRREFREQVIGHFDLPLLPPNARTRLDERTEKWTRYEVVLDVFEDVIAYGLLIVPNDIADGEQRPVVVCQHGLMGRPQDLIGDDKYSAYKAFATKLAERGFITFSPQNLYMGPVGDSFRILQFKANPMGTTLFSVMVPQHQQILRWLATMDEVDGDRIGFYGLSYGGKSAMRIPPLVAEYGPVICSADFNDWIDKVASTTNPRSYMWTGEYEIFEWDLGSTFNYAEMTALIAPRPFMVERGHFDTVADDWTVGWEFAQTRLLYQGLLGIGERCEIEWFAGPHAIHGKGTFKFLQQHLRWPPSNP
ncbi:MAG: hypothetical protein WD294_01395 [Phycisphaeraceae bacterium]